MSEKDQKSFGNYKKFFAMIAISMILMYFLTYLNSILILEHAWFSETHYGICNDDSYAGFYAEYV
jgi:hypothetical protein